MCSEKNMRIYNENTHYAVNDMKFLIDMGQYSAQSFFWNKAEKTVYTTVAILGISYCDINV